MEDKRDIPNPYDDYMPSTQKCNIITTEISRKFESCVLKLLANLDHKVADGNKDHTIYTGTTGVALLYYLISRRGNATYVKHAVGLIEKSLALSNNRYVSFLHGDAGPFALGAVVYKALGEKQVAISLITKLEAMLPCILRIKVPDEVLFGRAGYLYALLFANKFMEEEAVAPQTIQDVITAIIQSGINRAKRSDAPSPLMYQWHDKHYLGAAHGMSGILFMLLQARKYISESDMNKLIKPTINYLQSLMFPSGNFPSSLETEKDRLVQWCHGAPGMVDLFCLAYEVFDEPSYLETAIQCGEVVWQRGILKKGYSICHGVAGNGYVFLRLYKTTNDLKYLHRAYKFADWCVSYGKHQDHAPDRPLSLFEGIAGVIYFFIDLQIPEKAAFPAYALE